MLKELLFLYIKYYIPYPISGDKKSLDCDLVSSMIIISAYMRYHMHLFLNVSSTSLNEFSLWYWIQSDFEKSCFSYKILFIKRGVHILPKLTKNQSSRSFARNNGSKSLLPWCVTFNEVPIYIIRLGQDKWLLHQV